VPQKVAVAVSLQRFVRSASTAVFTVGRRKLVGVDCDAEMLLVIHVIN